MDVHNVCVTGYVHDDNGERVEFDKEGVNDIISEHPEVISSDLPEKAPKNIRVNVQGVDKKISIASKSIISRQSNVDAAKQGIDRIVDVMDDLDKENNLNDLWTVETQVSSVMASDELPHSIDLIKLKNAVDEHVFYYHHTEYRPSMGYVTLIDRNNTHVSVYKSGKFVIKGASSVEDVEETSKQLRDSVEMLSNK